MKARLNPAKLLWCTCLAMVWLGCNPREEGCLDPEAVTFNLDAERPCDDCCEYPELFVNVIYNWGTESFKLGVPYYRTAGDSLVFVRASVLLSGFGLIEENADTLRVLDRLELNCGDQGLISIPDDVITVDRLRFDYPVGMLKTSPNINEVFWYAGFPETYQCYDPEEIESGHPLSESGHYDPESGKALVAELIYSRDSLMTTDTLLLDFEAIFFREDVDKMLHFAKNDTVPFELDYYTLFDNVNLEAPIPELKLQLRDKFQDFVRFR